MDDKATEYLHDIRKLLVLQLTKGAAPATTDEIGTTLGVSGRAIRNIATTSKKPRKKHR
jgi:hypothetical protein